MVSYNSFMLKNRVFGNLKTLDFNRDSFWSRTTIDLLFKLQEPIKILKLFHALKKIKTLREIDFKFFLEVFCMILASDAKIRKMQLLDHF